ncbi:hypothetical protein [Pseudonocardia sp. TRM90224]|uniref:hypothetical protein n=1 Tax=Pseudonocardia sp. TRM90224 TaxID=2812678 RepID=UPI001E34C803|nr:hypothetical protein [Pseudonocardia sp. TRM90224]
MNGVQRDHNEPDTSEPSGPYTEGELQNALASVDDPAEPARAWLRAALADTIVPMHPSYLLALSNLFSVPRAYFDNEIVAEAINQRIDFATYAATRGITFTGPCRAQITDNELYSLQIRAVELLDQHLPPPTDSQK